MGTKYFGVLALLGFFALLKVQQTKADCCSGHWHYECEESKWMCGDKTEPTPCCGYGKCNIFCCNCDCRMSRHCREKIRTTTTAAPDTDRVLRSLDLNGDGVVDEREASYYVNMTHGPSVGFKFSSHDKDGDGFLSARELDS